MKHHVKKLRNDPQVERVPAQNFKLRLYSPLHIGGLNQDVLSGRFVETGDRIVVIDEDKLFQKLYQSENSNLIVAYLDYVLDNNPTGVRGFLDQHLSEYEPVKAYQLTKGAVVSNVRRFRCFARDTSFCPYVPGTAVKGAIRTAILYKLFDRNVFDYLFKPSVIRKLDDAIRNRQRPSYGVDSDTIAHFLQSAYYDTVQLNTADQQRADALFDLLKFLDVGDSEPLPADDLVLAGVDVVSMKQAQRTEQSWFLYVKTHLYAETLLSTTNEGIKFRIKFSSINAKLSQQQAKLNGSWNWEGLQTILEHFANKVLDAEYDYANWLWDYVKTDLEPELENRLDLMLGFYEELKSLPPERKPNLRLGWGSGLTGVTLRTALSDNRDGVVPKLKTAFRSFPPSPVEFPKSRRFVRQGDQMLPLGWCRIEPVTEGGV